MLTVSTAVAFWASRLISLDTLEIRGKHQAHYFAENMETNLFGP